MSTNKGYLLIADLSGYTAYFCDLNRRMQDEVIGRTEDRF